MAKSTKKTNTKSTAQSASAKRGTSKAAAGKKQTKPIRREIGGIICLFLGLFSVLSAFGVKSWFTSGLIGPLFRGRVGSAGFYILPVAFFLSFAILVFHGGRPVRMRVAGCFVIVMCIGAIAHLFLDTVDIPWGLSMVKALYQGGIAGTTGGLLCGFLAMLLEMLFSKIGAVLIFAVLLLVCLLVVTNMTLNSIVEAIRNRPRLEYDEPEEDEPDTAAAVVNYVAQKHIDHVQKVQKKRTADFDLPVDDPPVQTEEKPRRKRKVPSPDEYILEKRAEARQTPADKSEQPPVDLVASLPETEAEPRQETLWEEDVPVMEVPAAAAVADAGSQMEPEMLETFQQQQKVKSKEEKLAAAMVKEEVMQELDEAGGAPEQEYEFPPIDLLHKSLRGADGTAEMKENTKRLNETLRDFKIDATIVDVIRGPSVTRYELELASGVKLSKITGLAEDIALALGATGVRISAIPERVSIVGIEVPNKLTTTVSVREVLDTPQFANAKSKVAFAVGKDIGGKCIVGDIAKMPHMLIAGTTGSGKSVCMNSLIISLLYKAKPDEVKLIMVDPKMVELGIYNGIPHLLIPVVTDPKKAAGALQWAVTEMLRRYRMMSDAGVRNLEEYNRQAEHDDDYEKMPQIVVIIDELADLMLVAAKEVEESICRVAQMGRASGIHLIVATQRPSADVITGLMKANIPSRIAFAVASTVDSRIILDTIGAEKLVGKGDMLYAPLGQGKPKRIQGCFISDEEVQAVVSFIKQHETVTDYSPAIIAEIDMRAEQGGKGQPVTAATADHVGFACQDELLPQAVEVILETKQASVSMLQRRLKLGYARAARIVDEMEDKGIVGPFEGSKPRQLLITKEQWEAMRNGQTMAAPEPVEEELEIQ